jgi:iron complex outermembrane receptor protein
MRASHNWRSVLLAGVSITALGLVAPAVAQDAQPASQDDDQAASDAPVEQVVVTGSRLRKDEFTSPSPVSPRGYGKSCPMDGATSPYWPR